MNNAERDDMLKSINDTLDGVHDSVIRMEEHAHNPLECPVMSDHKESHGRHIRWWVWGIGGAATVLGGLVALIRVVAAMNGG